MPFEHDPARQMGHSEDALRRAREARDTPGVSGRDHRGRLVLWLWIVAALVVLGFLPRLLSMASGG